MKFLIDQQLPPALAGWLKAKGHDAVHVYLVGLGDAADHVIWDHALSESAIIITKDADYAERRERERSGPIILWLRVGNTTTPELFRTLEAAWPSFEAAVHLEAVIEVR